MIYKLSYYKHIQPLVKTHLARHPEKDSQMLAAELIGMTMCPILPMMYLLKIERPDDPTIMASIAKIKAFYRDDVLEDIQDETETNKVATRTTKTPK